MGEVTTRQKQVPRRGAVVLPDAARLQRPLARLEGQEEGRGGYSVEEKTDLNGEQSIDLTATVGVEKRIRMQLRRKTPATSRSKTPASGNEMTHFELTYRPQSRTLTMAPIGKNGASLPVSVKVKDANEWDGRDLLTRHKVRTAFRRFHFQKQ